MPAGGGDQRELVARLRAVIEAKDAENAMLRAELEAQRERYRRLELRVAELERRLGSDSTTSGTPPSKDPIGTRERRKAERRGSGSPRSGNGARTASAAGSRGIPGRACRGIRTRTSGPRCRRRRSARGAGPGWRARSGRAPGGRRSGTCRSRRFVTEYLLPLLACPCCGKVNAAQAPPWAHPGSVSYGPGINTAAVLLSSYGNVPVGAGREPDRHAARRAGLRRVRRPGQRAAVRPAATTPGSMTAMQAALAAEPVLAADETPVNLLDPHAGLAGGGRGRTARAGRAHPAPRADLAAGARLPAGRRDHRGPVVLHRVLDQRRVLRLPAARCRSSPGCSSAASTSSAAAARSPSWDPAACSPGPPTSSRSSARRTRPSRTRWPGATRPWTRSFWRSCAERYDEAVAFGITHNRHRDWHDGNHPGYALGCWLRDYKEQVWLFTREFAVEWTNNCSEQAVKAAKRHQAVSGYWHTPRTLARWCRIRSYLDSAANHGLTALDAITRALAGDPWLPVPAAEPNPKPQLTGTPLNGHVSAARLYWENKASLYNAADVFVPAAVSVFPGENYQAPRRRTERAYHNLIYYNKLDKGGHFAAWEQPRLFSEEVRAGFRPLRK